MQSPVVIAAGGTGGHVFPGLAVADALVKEAGVRAVFAGTPRGFEGRLVPAAGYEVELFDVVPIHGGGIAQAGRGGVRAAAALRHATAFLRETKPRVVVSIGGYAAGPLALSAAMLGIPITLVEPNSVMGLSNRVVAPFARRVYLAFEEARPRFLGNEVRLAGVPLREGFSPRPARASGERRVLVLGGSQGALALNERVPAALAKVASRLGGPSRVAVLHQAGEGKDAVVRDAYAKAGMSEARVVTFSDHPADDLAWADVVVARAGAGTLAEIAAIGRASLLIPLPTAAGDHQARNAAAYARTGAAVWLRQGDADVARLERELFTLLTDDALRARHAECAEAQGRPEAARSIARDLRDLLEAA